MNIGNLIPCSFAFSKSSLYIWKFLVHIQLKPSWRILSITLLAWKWAQWYGCLNILWNRPSLGLEWKLIFSSPVATAEFFQICWHIECGTFTASAFRIWNSSTGIPSPPLALFVVMLPKAHLASHSRMSGSRWLITPSWLSGSLRSLCIVLRVFLPPLLNLFCFCYVLAISVLYCACVYMNC